MACSVSILINDTGARTSTDRAGLKPSDTTNRLLFVNTLQNYINEFASGNGSGTIRLDVASAAVAQATGTVTCASVQAGDTVTINGVTFTAVSGTPAANEFDISGTDSAAATSLAAAIVASVTALVSGYVTATADSAVVTVKSLYYGQAGNTHTLASSNGTRLAVSGARLTGGTGGASTSGANAYSFGA